MKKLILLLTLGTSLLAGDILEEIDRNLTPVSAQMYKKLINIEPDGSKKRVSDIPSQKRQRQDDIALFRTRQ